MNHSRTDIIVGIFVLAGAICLGYLAIRLGKVELFGATGLRRLCRLLFGRRPKSRRPRRNRRCQNRQSRIARLG